MATKQYGSSLKGELFSFVHRVCQTELGVSMGRERTVQWTAHPEAFAGYLALNPVKLKFPPNNRNNNFFVNAFELVIDNGDTSLYVSREDPGNLNGDVWIESVLDQANNIFESHSHEACIALYATEEEGTPLSRLRSIHGEVLQV